MNKAGKNSGIILNVLIFFLFAAYAVYFLFSFGNRLNEQVMKFWFRAFTADKEDWVWISYFMGIVYFFWISAVFYIIAADKSESLNNLLKKRAILLFFCASFFLRIIPAMIVFGPGSDIKVFQLANQMTLAGGWGQAQEIMPYYYLEVYFLHLMGLVGKLTNLPGYFLVKIPGIIFDALITVMIFKITGKKRASAAYMFNPVSILVTSYHGMFDAVTLFFLLAAFLYSKKEMIIRTGIAFGLAVQSKMWPVILLGVILKKKVSDNIKIIISWAFVFLLFSMPVIFYSDYYITPFKYSGVGGYYGLSGILFYLSTRFTDYPEFYGHSIIVLKVIFYLVLLLSVFLSRKMNMLKGAFFVILSFYIFCPAWSIQYYIWLSVFLTLFNLHKTVYFACLTGIVAIFYFTSVNYDLLTVLAIRDFHARTFFAFLSLIPVIGIFGLWFKILKKNAVKQMEGK